MLDLPNIKSSIKSMRVDAKRRARNVFEKTRIKKAQKQGYKPALISFRNGRMAVGLCPSNNIKDAFEGLKKVKQESFCPSDVWVLRNE